MPDDSVQRGYIPSIHSDRQFDYLPGIHHAPNPANTSDTASRRSFLFAAGAVLAGAYLKRNDILNYVDDDSFDMSPEARGSVHEFTPSIEVPAPEMLPSQSQEKFNAHVGKIDELRAVYDEIEKETGVPWMMMAGLHYREASNRPDGSMFAGEKIGGTNPDHGDVKGTSLLENGIKAAKHFIDGAARIYGITVRPDMTDEELVYALLAFNRGSMYKNAIDYIGREMNPDESPYVYNGLDEPHLNMHWPDMGHYSKNGGSWGEPESVQGKPNTPLGAMTIIRGLRNREVQPAPRKVVFIGDSLGVGFDKFGKMQDADAFFNQEIIFYDAQGSRPLDGEFDGRMAIQGAVDTLGPDLSGADSLIIELGTNMPESESRYEEELRAIIGELRVSNAELKVVMPEIVSFVDGTKMGGRRDARNAILRKLNDEGVIIFVPVRDIVKDHMAGDDIHLDAKGYELMTLELLKNA